MRFHFQYHHKTNRDILSIKSMYSPSNQFRFEKDPRAWDSRLVIKNDLLHDPVADPSVHQGHSYRQ